MWAFCIVHGVKTVLHPLASGAVCHRAAMARARSKQRTALASRIDRLTPTPAVPLHPLAPAHMRCDQIMGGVAMAQPFYTAALYAEGRVPEGPMAEPGQVVLTARRGDAVELIVAAQVRMIQHGRWH